MVTLRERGRIILHYSTFLQNRNTKEENTTSFRQVFDMLTCVYNLEKFSEHRVLGWPTILYKIVKVSISHYSSSDYFIWE